MIPIVFFGNLILFVAAGAFAPVGFA